jgi:hypothetical protein
VLWDSVPAFHTDFMVRFAVRPRLLLTTGSAVVACLLLASASYAAPAPRKSSFGRLCGPQTTSFKKLPRHPKSFGGPLAMPSKHALAGLTDWTARIKRGSQTDLEDDDEAIQNDAPAAQIDHDDRATPVLRPLGLCHGSRTRPLHTRPLSPRPTRGPPADAS